MTVLDAFAVLAFLKGEAAATNVASLLEASPVSLTAVGLAEVLDHLVRQAGVDEENATLDVAQLGLLDAIPISSRLGAAAGRLRARYYNRSRCPISLADCIAAEVARELDRPLATSDPPLLAVCHAEDIPTVVLPSSNGTTRTPTSA